MEHRFYASLIFLPPLHRPSMLMRGGGTAVQVQNKMLSGTRRKNWSEEVVLVTGGTGSFGRKFVEIMPEEHRPKKLIIFSRDESK